jgi:hypothetical protein
MQWKGTNEVITDIVSSDCADEIIEIFRGDWQMFYIEGMWNADSEIA